MIIFISLLIEKTRYSTKKKHFLNPRQSFISSSSTFSTLNSEKNISNIQSLPYISSNQWDLQPIIDPRENKDHIPFATQNHADHENIPFVLPTCSIKYNIIYSSPLFTSPESVKKNKIKNLHFITPITIFITILNDVIMDLKIFHTHFHVQ